MSTFFGGAQLSSVTFLNASSSSSVATIYTTPSGFYVEAAIKNVTDASTLDILYNGAALNSRTVGAFGAITPSNADANLRLNSGDVIRSIASGKSYSIELRVYKNP